jgi:catechol 2,3-dioxygenase-like lactoylglutathione lyase family enzyme
MRFLSALSLAAASLAWSQTGAPPRPKITGVAHIALAVHDIEKSRAYYKDFLGYGEPYKLDNPDGSLSLTFIKVNERQYIELFPEKTAGTDRLLHISIEVESAEGMRAYLKSKGVKVPDQVSKGRIKNSNFMVTDPDGHLVEIVQYNADGLTVQAKGKFLDDNPAGPRVSQRMSHLGIIVGALEPAMKFYGGILGFQEIWRGSKDGKVLSWVNLKVPEGNDYLEFMLYDQMPDLKTLGTLHHICLEVPDIEKSKAVLEARPARAAHTRPLEIRTGVNRKRQMNLYDPDGTRSELMEPQTVDGKPTPPSTAAPPR